MATGTIFSASTGFAQPDPSLDLPGDIVSSNGNQIVIRNADPVTGVLDGTVSVYIADPTDPLIYDANGIPVDGTIIEVQHQSTDNPATQILLSELTGLSVSVFDLFIPLAMGDLDAHFRALQAGDETWTSADGDGSQIFGFDGDDTITGSAFDDVLNGGSGFNILRGGDGDDQLIGSGVVVDSSQDFNGISFDDALDDVTVQISGGVNSTTSTAFSTSGGNAAGIGTDTIVNAEYLIGSDFDDTVTVAANFVDRYGGSFFEFEGGAGDDSFTHANNQGRVGYRFASDGVRVDLDLGTATSINPGDSANVGTDTFSGVFSIRGSDFDDELFGRSSGSDQFRPRAGNDLIDGRGGSRDELRYSSTDLSVIVDLGPNNQTTAATTTSDGFGGTDTFIGIERLRGGRGDDQLTGDVNNNRLRGGDGDDVLVGRGGDDDLRGEGGNDRLFGGDGNDVLRGGIGDVVLEGGTVDDFLQGSSDFTVSGNETIDIPGFFDFTRASYRDALDDVTIILDGAPGSGLGQAFSTNLGDTANIGVDTLESIEFIFGSDFDDTLVVEAGYSGRFGAFVEFQGGAGDDSFTNNSSGSGRINVADALDDVTIDFVTGTAFSTNGGNAAGIGTDTFTNVRQVRASDFDDAIFGANVGFQTFRPRGGDDFIDGGTGAGDELRYTSATSSVVISLGTDNQTTQATTTSDGFGGIDTFIGIERLRGGTGDDQLTGDVNDNRLRGHFGDDTLNGGGGNDELRGETGDDILNGGLGSDTLFGGTGDDVLNSGGGFDNFNGGAGDDVFNVQIVDQEEDGAQADYRDATSAIVVNYTANAQVWGDASVGNDTLNTVWRVLGSQFDDIYFADNTFSNGQFADALTFQEFRGGGGDDFITGNGNTRLSYRDAIAAVTVDLATGTAFATAGGDAAGIGFDEFTGVNRIRGGAFDDALFGSDSAGFEQFRGRQGNDLIDGRGGLQDQADYRNSPNAVFVDLTLSSGQAVADGWGFTDTLMNIEWVRGSVFDDTIIGDGADNTFVGRAGNDELSAGAGNDELDGGDGNDRLDGGTGADVLRGGFGDDTYVVDNVGDTVSDEFGGGTDTVESSVTIAINSLIENLTLFGPNAINGFGNNLANVITGNDQNNILGGNNGADTLNGEGGDDELRGGNGDDTLNGGAGDDTLLGGSGADTINGGDGADTVQANAQADLINGGAGNDNLNGGNGNDLINGGTGDDILNGANDSDTLNGDDGNDQLFGQAQADILNGGGGNDLLIGGAGNDTLNGDAGNDRLEGLADSDTLNGGDGDDELFGGSRADTLNGGGDNDTLFGEGGDDILNGDAGDDMLFGGVNNDTLTGGDGADQLFGEQQADVLNGGNGDDLLDGGNGNDTLFGDNGNDTLRGGFNVDMLDGGAGADLLFGDQQGDTLNGGNGNDTLDGGGGNDTLNGGNDNDILRGGFNNDILNGDAGADQLFGDAQSDTLDGGGGNDMLFGGAGNDTLIGGFNDDVLDGGTGNDMLTGGAQFDRFVFAAGYDSDVVKDFQNNVDSIDLSSFGFAATNDAFAFGSQSGTDYVFNFGGGDILRVENATEIQLANDLIIA